jgi:hypothetical protein
VDRVATPYQKDIVITQMSAKRNTVLQFSFGDSGAEIRAQRLFVFASHEFLRQILILENQ